MPRSSVVRLLATLFIGLSMVGGPQVTAQNDSTEWVMFCGVGENGESTYVVTRQRYDQLDHSNGNTYQGECASDAANGWQALMTENTVVTYCDSGLTKQAPANTIGIRIELRYRDMPTSFLMWNEAPSGIERGPCDSNGDGGDQLPPEGWELVTSGDMPVVFCYNGETFSTNVIGFAEFGAQFYGWAPNDQRDLDTYIAWPLLAPEITQGECESENGSDGGENPVPTDFAICVRINGELVGMYPYEARDRGYLVDEENGIPTPVNGAWWCTDGEPGNGEGGDNGIGNGQNGGDNGNGGETPGNGESGETPGDGDALENSFTLTTAQRMCADQSFRATWTGNNVESLQFTLNNTSDNWTSGWLEADPAVGVFTTEVDHHNYDKVGAQVTFTDGTVEQFSADTSNCAAAEVPAPVNPPVNSGSGTSGGSSGGGQSTAAVSSLPSTGIGTSNAGLLVLASAAVMMLAGAAAITRLAISRR